MLFDIDIQGDPKKISLYGNLNILAMLCCIITQIYRIAKEIIWHMWAKFHVYAPCYSKVMALLLKKHVFHFYMPNFFFITGLKTRQNMKKHKMIFKWANLWAQSEFNLQFKLNEQVSASSSINELPESCGPVHPSEMLSSFIKDKLKIRCG